MDCFLLWRPWKNNQHWKPKTEGLHIDQNPFHKYKTKIWCSMLSWGTSYDKNLLPGWVFNASREWYRYYLWITRFSFKKIFLSFLADLLLQISASFLAIFSQDFHSGWRSGGGSQVAHWLCTRHCQVIGVNVIFKIYRIVKRKNHPHLKESGDFCPVQGKHFTEAAVRRIVISQSKFC